MSLRAARLIEDAEIALALRPHENVRLPNPVGNRAPVKVDALWTSDDLAPHWENVFFLVHQLQPDEGLEEWKTRVRKWPVRGALLGVGEKCHLLVRDRSGHLGAQIIELDEVRAEVARRGVELLPRSRLAALRKGQLSFADLDVPLTPESLAFLSRHRADLRDSLRRGIEDAKKAAPAYRGAAKATHVGHIVRLAVAFAAARILEDKGYLGPSANGPTDDPRQLLKLTVNRTNGFFKNAAQESLPHLGQAALNALSAHLGSAKSFALVSHHDVGEFYETAIHLLPKELQAGTWGDLQQHYTPVAIGAEMLAHLPLERIRPEHRVIFDPAAGSGSLLLAASLRLAKMDDVPAGRGLRAYLESHVRGNDIDPFAGMVTRLRYCLVSAALHRGIDHIPSPQLLNDDYRKLDRARLNREKLRPTVVVANPPFKQEGSIQLATEFVRRALEWLDVDGQFAIILPDVVLGGTKRGAEALREQVARECQLLEVWRLPEKVVGTRADQAVCVLLGIKGRTREQVAVVRSITSRRKELASSAQLLGFLGRGWVGELPADASDWCATQRPAIDLTGTVTLEEAYEVQIGATLKPGMKGVLRRPRDTVSKRFWKAAWRGSGNLWANPKDARAEERWMPWDEQWLKKKPVDDHTWFDHPKLMIGNSVNPDSDEPLAACMDTVGLMPNHYLFCVRPRAKSDILGWNRLNEEDRLLWLLGILRSDLGVELVESRRSGRHIPAAALRKMPIPGRVDKQVSVWVSAKIGEEQAHLAPSGRDDLHTLNHRVQLSYGVERHRPLRSSMNEDLEAWSSAREQPTITIIGQVIDRRRECGVDQVLLHVNGGLGDGEREGWLDLPQELPGWTLDGSVFHAEVDARIGSFEELSKSPWALRRIRHASRPYLDVDDLTKLFEPDPPS